MTPDTTPPWTGEDTFGYDPVATGNGPNPFIAEFEKLGTYKVQYTAKLTRATLDGDENCDPDGNNVNQRFCATETYTFHVGPITDIEVASAQQTPEGLEITAINNGPSHSQGARAVLATGESCEFGGVFQHRDWLWSNGQPRTRTCVIPGAQLTGAQLAGDAPIGKVENHVDYTVCIGSDGNDVTPEKTSKTACERVSGASWHSVDVLEYDESNNEIFLTGTGAPAASALTLHPLRPKAMPNIIVSWTRLDELFGAPVSYYQVERLDDDEWNPLANVPQTADRGEDPHYEDGDEERGDSPRYRVRAVNEEGLAGPWAESGVARQGVALALDRKVIQEPDPVDAPHAMTTATITATLSGPVSGKDITINVSAEAVSRGVNDAAAFRLSDSRALTIPAGERDSRGVVTVTANEDADSENEEIRITAVGTHGGNIPSLTLEIDDDDDPGLTLGALTPAQINEQSPGNSATFTVKLDSQPSLEVRVKLSSGNDDDVTTDTDELTFTADDWETAQTVTVSAMPDDDAADDIATITLQASGAFEYRSVVAKLEVPVIDQDTAAITVDADAPLRIVEGGSGSYTVRLDTLPTANVVIEPSSDNSDVRVSPSRLTFTPRNWDREQTVTVSASHDDDAMITHAVADGSAEEYADPTVTIADVIVEVMDDEAPADYDDYGGSSNGLIDITTREQLNAIRWDLDGNGVADDAENEDRYAAAFPRIMENMCSAGFTRDARGGNPGPCTGYELTDDIALSGSWTPIGGNLHFDDYDTPLEEFRADFDGNGNTISNLSISRGDGKNIGLFGAVAGGAELRNVGLEDVNVRGRKHVGALAGRSNGTITDAWSTGEVRGNSFTGGLVGWNMNNGSVERSYSGADVTGWNASDSGGPIWSTRIAGLVGGNYGRIANTYATGSARGRGYVAGLAGENSHGNGITNSYSVGAVSTEEDWPLAGGLVGLQGAAVTGSYWNIETSGRSDGAGQGGLSGAVGLDTAALQSLTAAATGWDSRVWNFRTNSEYPCLIGVSSDCDAPETLPNRRASVAVTAADPVEITEGVSTATYTVVLEDQPTGNVVITASSDNDDVTTQPASLTFTPDNWHTAQTVAVSAIRDDDAVNDTATISHEASGGNYNGATIADVTVSITDDDTAGIRVSETDLSVNEGGTATYTVSLDAQPVENVSIFVSAQGQGVTVQPTQLTFTPANWRDAQTVTVSAAQDHNTDNEQAGIIHGLQTAPGSAYEGLTVAPVVVSVTDDDELVAQPASQAGRVSVDPLTLTVTEGGDGVAYEVSLEVEPSENVVIAVSSNDGDVTVQPPQLTFTPGDWETAQTVTVSAAQDEDQDNDAATITHAVSGGNYDGVTAAAVAVSVTDDDAAQPAQQQEPVPEPGSVTVSTAELDVGEGSAATYTVVLDIRPSANVVIDVSSDNADVGVQPTELTFTADDWQDAQTVTVSAADDEDSDDETATVSHAVRGGNYDGVTAASVAVSVTDDDEQEAEEPAEPVSVPDPNRAALEAFYNATGGAGWTNSTNWLSEQPLGEWHGVTVDEQGEVTALVLDGNNLTGSLPAELGNLSGLTRLALNRNGITGAIPSQLGSLSDLSIIGIARNQLSGSLPTELGNLSGLTRLSLHDNTALSGALPSGFTGLTSLQRLAIANTGICIPADDAFSDWLAAVSDKPGIEGLTACASP